jgi:hypothetical protein
MSPAATTAAASASVRDNAAAVSCSPRNAAGSSSSSNTGNSRGSPSARDGRVGGLPGRAAASAPCSPHGKALGLSIATRVGERQGKDQ